MFWQSFHENVQKWKVKHTKDSSRFPNVE